MSPNNHLLTYFVINPGIPVLRVNAFFTDYDRAQKISAKSGSRRIVTTGSWLRSQCVPLVVTEQMKGIIHTGKVDKVFLNGVELRHA